MEIIVAGQATLGRDNIRVRIAIGNVVDGGIGMTADAAIFRSHHLTNEQRNIQKFESISLVFVGLLDKQC